MTPLVQSIPPEILTHIFSLALRTDIPYLAHSRKQSPLNVSQVCSSWRGIALETSSLWSHLTFPVSIVDTYVENIWHLWLARSNQQTLRFDISNFPPHNIALLFKLVRIMVDNFDRWRDVRVKTHNIISVIIPYFPPTMEKLYCTGFSVMYRTPSMTNEWLSKLASSAEWRYTNEFHAVTVVELRMVPDYLYEELSGVTRVDSDSERSLDDTRLSRYMDRTESNLFASNLKHLHVFRFDYMFERGKFGLADLICRSAASLEVLTLSYSDINAFEICCILNHSLKLKELRLAGCRSLNMDDMHNLLKVGSNSSEVTCPAFQLLELIDMYALGSGGAQSFVDMIVSRWRYADSKGISLSVIAHTYDLSGLSAEQREELRSCISEGLYFDRGFATGLDCFPIV